MSAEGRTVILAVIAYTTAGDVDDDEVGSRLRIGLTEDAKGMLSTLTDFELKVFAYETGLVVRKHFEMPPSPAPK